MKYFRPAILSLLLFSVITGLAYPMLITCLAQVLFPDAANGSVVTLNNQVVGSSLIGQEFRKPAYFWSRLSAAVDSTDKDKHQYFGLGSAGTNLGPTNPALLDEVNGRIADLKKYPTPTGPIPVDLVTSSASGLDPHITPAAAYYQVPRVAQVRHMAAGRLRELIASNSQGSWGGFLGEARVNVLALNMALDKLNPTP
jgi:K+-transporting ATPase ATPase C chain